MKLSAPSSLQNEVVGIDWQSNSTMTAVEERGESEDNGNGNGNADRKSGDAQKKVREFENNYLPVVE